MNATPPYQEALDRIVLLLASQPRAGWEDVYEEFSRREVDRLTLNPASGHEPALHPVGSNDA